jgi:hypothetical protein
LKSLVSRAATVAALLLAVGCNSSGSSELTISEQNAQSLAAQGVAAATMLEEMGGLVEGFSEVLNEPAAQTIPCDTGEIIVSVMDIGTTGLSTGDTASIRFNACGMDLGGEALLLNGTMSFQALEVTGTAPGPFTVRLGASFGQLTVGVLGATVIVNGGLTLELSSPDGVTLTSIVSGSSLSASAQAGSQVFSGSLSNFHLERSLDTSNGDYLVDLDATVYSSELGGSAVFETTIPFTGNGDNPPDAGTFVATGAEGATITVTALGGGAVQILIDADWDGVDEATQDTTWDALENA